MPPKYAPQYVDRLLASEAHEDLATLSSMICSSARFNQEASDYGLPQFAFLFVETLLWFAQAVRSGAWTYYEATPPERLDAMLAALAEAAPKEFSLWYEKGMRSWRDDTVTDVDDWMKSNDEAANAWIRTLLRHNRDAVLELVAS
jgi:hypothetical protein